VGGHRWFNRSTRKIIIITITKNNNNDFGERFHSPYNILCRHRRGVEVYLYYFFNLSARRRG
jgi:hypothetical protein